LHGSNFFASNKTHFNDALAKGASPLHLGYDGFFANFQLY
jgi:hypothetical protein